MLRRLIFVSLLLLAAAPGVTVAQGPPPAAPAGDTATSAEQWAAAERRLRAAIQLNPEVASFHASLAEALRRQGRYPEALAALREAVRIDPREVRYRGQLAATLLELQEWSRAEIQFRQAILLDSTRAELHAGLSQALRAQGRADEANQALSDAVRLAPDDPEIRRLRLDAERSGGAIGGLLSVHGAMELLGTLFRFLAALALIVLGTGLLLPMVGVLYLLLVRLPLAAVLGSGRGRRETPPRA